MTTDAEGVTPDDLRHLARAVKRAADEVGGGLGRLMQGWSDSMMLLATGFDQNLRAGASAEQLSIALMAQARKLYATRGSMSTAYHAQADRLARWASDVRSLGVHHFRALSLEKQTALLAADKMAATERKLGLVRELCESKLGSVYDDDTQRMAQEVLEVLGE